MKEQSKAEPGEICPRCMRILKDPISSFSFVDKPHENINECFEELLSKISSLEYRVQDLSETIYEMKRD